MTAPRPQFSDDMASSVSNFLRIVAVFGVIFVGARGSDDDGVYKIGVGIGDITGPPAGVVLVRSDAKWVT